MLFVSSKKIFSKLSNGQIMQVCIEYSISPKKYNSTHSEKEPEIFFGGCKYKKSIDTQFTLKKSPSKLSQVFLKGAEHIMLKNKKTIDEIINNYIGKKGALIPLLQEIQKVEKYLSPETMKYVSEKTGIKLAEIYGVVTFYTMFRLKPQGDHVIRVCKGTACHVSDADTILTSVKSELNLQGENDTTEDGKFTIMVVACLGCCSLAPVIMIDDNTYGKLTSDSIKKILKTYN